MSIMNIRNALGVFLVCLSAASFAHGDEEHTGPVVREQTEWGIAGNVRAAKRSIEIRMLDTMRFVPEQISVRQGETVKLVLKNDGQMLHEFVLGTQKKLEEHAALMIRFPNMEHSEPYMAHVPVGKSRTIIWTFNRTGTFEFACLMPGHYQAGMKGQITVTGK